MIKLNNILNNNRINKYNSSNYGCFYFRFSPSLNKLNLKTYYDYTFNDVNVKNYSSMSKKNKEERVKIWIDWDVFEEKNLLKFKQSLFSTTSKLKVDTLYNLFIKVRYNTNNFIMLCDSQKSVKFISTDDNKISSLFEDILDFIRIMYDDYIWEEDEDFKCEALLLDFWVIEVPEHIKISNINVLKDLVSEKTAKYIDRDFKLLDLPWNEYKNRVNLDVALFKNGKEEFDIYDDFFLNKEGKGFIHRFNQERKSGNKNYIFRGGSEFYLLSFEDKHYIIVNEKIEENIWIKKGFNMNGTLITKVKDTLSEDVIIREYKNNRTIHFNKENKVVLVEKNYEFKSIGSEQYKANDKDLSWLPNTKIGTLDLETYEDNGISKCYALGFYTHLEECNTYYIDKDLDSVKLIHNCINEMLRPKYSNITFYVHNLGGFDAPFIIKSLSLFNKTKEGVENPYSFGSNTRDNDILRLTIKRKIDGKIRSVKLVDSLALLPKSLKDLCKDYEVGIDKGYFPYNFVNKETLFYKGKTPDIKQYKNISKEEYMNINKEVWSLKDECIIYLKNDLVSLYKVIEKAIRGFFLKFNIQMTDVSTISGLSSKIYLEQYYDKEKSPLPLIQTDSIWKDIHSAYYGGRVEVYNPRVKSGENVYYYDVNSLYPYASLNTMPGLKCKYVEFTLKPDLKNLFGFFYCKVKTPVNDYLGLLPYRTPKGNLLFPTGEWYAWYFSEELKFVSENGYEIDIIKGYNFDKTHDAFTSFVENIYEIKSNPSNKTERNLAKLILNSLIGRFGMYFNKVLSELVNKERHEILSVSRVMKNFIEIDDDLYLDSYIPGINKKICQEFNVDFVKLLNTENVDENSSVKSYKSVSITTAAATISYARIYMGKIMLHILKQGGKIYYSDTDSIVTNIKLNEDLVDPKKIGKLKLECEIDEGYFIADKLYGIKTVDGEIIKRAKGVNSNLLNFSDYDKLFKQKTLKNTIRTSSVRDYAAGSVTIKDKKIILNTSTYNKRAKIYKDNVWTGTKPFYIKAIETFNKGINNVTSEKFLREYSTKNNLKDHNLYSKWLDTSPLYTENKSLNMELCEIKVVINKASEALINTYHLSYEVHSKLSYMTGESKTWLFGQSVDKDTLNKWKHHPYWKEIRKPSKLTNEDLPSMRLEELVNYVNYTIAESNTIIGNLANIMLHQIYKDLNKKPLIKAANNLNYYKTRKNTFLKKDSRQYSTLSKSSLLTCSLPWPSLILTPIISSKDNLIAPIICTPDIKYHITKCDMILSRISDNNFVKQFLIKELNKKIKVCAIESSHTESIINYISSIDTYNIKKGSNRIIKRNGHFFTIKEIISSVPNNIARNDYSYNNFSFLSFDHIFSNSNLYNVKNSLNKKNINQFIHNKELKLNDYNSKQITREWKILLDGDEKILNLDSNYYKLKKHLDYSNTNLISCSYAITFNNNLYFYIGSSTKITDRVKRHNSNIEKYIDKTLNYPQIVQEPSHSESIIPYFIHMEILNNFELSYNIHPIYISTNYLNKFQKLYHEYILSRGEWILLKYATELIIKILEQSLINKFKPKLNTLQTVGFTYWPWLDSYLDEIISEKSVCKIYGQTHKYIIKLLINKNSYDLHQRLLIDDSELKYIKEDDNYFCVMPPRTEYYLIKKYNLNIDEVLDNINKIHFYKNCLLNQPIKIEILN